MNILFRSVILFIVITNIHLSFSQQPIPSLQKKGNTMQLIVDGKPFIILGGEVGNSSATTMQYMQSIWPKLKAMNLNTVLIPVIISIQGEGKIEGVLLERDQDTIIQFGKYSITCKHEYSLGWSPGAKEDEWPVVSTIIIQMSDNEFFIAGSGVVVTFNPLQDETLNAGILKAEEGRFENNQWVILRHLNGDQTHQGRHMRIPFGDYTIQRLELYTYK